MLSFGASYTSGKGSQYDQKGRVTGFLLTILQSSLIGYYGDSVKASFLDDVFDPAMRSLDATIRDIQDNIGTNTIMSVSVIVVMILGIVLALHKTISSLIHSKRVLKDKQKVGDARPNEAAVVNIAADVARPNLGPPRNQINMVEVRDP